MFTVTLPSAAMKSVLVYGKEESPALSTVIEKNICLKMFC